MFCPVLEHEIQAHKKAAEIGTLTHRLLLYRSNNQVRRVSYI